MCNAVVAVHKLSNYDEGYTIDSEWVTLMYLTFVPAYVIYYICSTTKASPSPINEKNAAPVQEAAKLVSNMYI